MILFRMYLLLFNILQDGPRGPEGVPLDRRAYVYGACFTGIILYSLPREYVTYKQSEMYVKPHEEKGWLEG